MYVLKFEEMCLNFFIFKIFLPSAYIFPVIESSIFNIRMLERLSPSNCQSVCACKKGFWRKLMEAECSQFKDH